MSLPTSATLTKTLSKLIPQFDENLHSITPERKKQLELLTKEIMVQLAQGKSVVKFICTHNSRRSQLAEFMLDVLARHFGLNILALSAGTESTAFNSRMITALTDFGFDFLKYGSEPNPLYIYRVNELDLYYFSKKYDEELINYGETIVVTVCNHADETCPVIPGTFKRLHLGYLDPKKSDGTSSESETYRNKVLEIGTEMYYVVSQIVHKQL